MPADLIIRSARVRGRSDSVEIVVDGGRIRSVGAPSGAEGATEIDALDCLVLPGLVNPHQHLDKTLIGDDLRPDRWPGAHGLVDVNRRHRAGYDVASILARAERIVEMALANGTTAMRAFTDIEASAGLAGTEALVALRERYRGEVEIAVVPFPQEMIYAAAGGEDLLRAAMQAGADVVGGLPSGEATDELMRRHVDFCLALAREHDADIHMLLDDSDDPAQRSLEYLALRTIEAGWEGRVTVGHAGALSAYDHPHAEMVIRRVHDAGISVCVNAHISLVLQGRSDRGAIRRGITRAGELLDAGVNVIAGQDDIDDPYYPLGRGDQLEVAQYTAHVCHLAWPAELETVIDMVTVNAARAMRLADYGLAPGDRADLVVCGSPDVRSTLAELAPRRAVVANGRLAVSSRLEVTRHPRA